MNVNSVKLLSPVGCPLKGTYETMMYADIVLTCGMDDNEISPVCHKSVLASSSDFLRNLLEMNPSSHQLILPDISSKTMINILQLIYTGETNVSSQAEITKIIQGIELLQIHVVEHIDIVKICQEYQEDVTPCEILEKSSKEYPQDDKMDLFCEKESAVQVQMNTFEETEEESLILEEESELNCIASPSSVAIMTPIEQTEQTELIDTWNCENKLLNDSSSLCVYDVKAALRSTLKDHAYAHLNPR